MKCVCPCEREFEPQRRNQIYYEAACREKDKNRRWPRVSAEMLAALSRDSLGERIEAVHRSDTAWGGDKVAQIKSQRKKANWEKRESDEFLSRFQVARLIGVSAWTLIYWARTDKGPPFVKMARGTVRYPRVDLGVWLASLRPTT